MDAASAAARRLERSRQRSSHATPCFSSDAASDDKQLATHAEHALADGAEGTAQRDLSEAQAAVEARQLFSGEWPLIFSPAQQHRRSQPLPQCVMLDDATRASIRRHLAGGPRTAFEASASPQAVNQASLQSAQAQRSRIVRLSRALRTKLPSLFECGDPRCACNRLLRPWARFLFKAQLVAEAFASHTKGGSPPSSLQPVHYVSIGSGALLSDIDVLCSLQDAGLAIASATFIDRAYRVPASVGWQALAELAAFLCAAGGMTRVLPAELHAYTGHAHSPASLAHLRSRCLTVCVHRVRSGPSTRLAAYPSATTYVLARMLELEPTASLYCQMDAAIPWRHTAATSAVALREGGLGLRLSNRNPTCATMDVWERVAAPTPSPLLPAFECARAARAHPATAARLLETVEETATFALLRIVWEEQRLEQGTVLPSPSVGINGGSTTVAGIDAVPMAASRWQHLDPNTAACEAAAPLPKVLGHSVTGIAPAPVGAARARPRAQPGGSN